mgnify:CR=1 FL=1
MKWIAPSLAYLAVGLGTFVFHSAWGALLGFHAAIIVSLLIAKPTIPLKILLTNNNPKWIFLSVLLCGASGMALYFLWDIFGFASDLSGQVASLGLNASNWPVFIAYFALVNPWIEEYFWRGWLGTMEVWIVVCPGCGLQALALVTPPGGDQARCSFHFPPRVLLSLAMCYSRGHDRAFGAGR